jgi:hypothetical protein
MRLHKVINLKSPKDVGSLTFGIKSMKVEFKDLFTIPDKHDSSTTSKRSSKTKSKKWKNKSTIHLSGLGLLSLVKPLRTTTISFL